jgi:hypothetical protein
MSTSACRGIKDRWSTAFGTAIRRDEASQSAEKYHVMPKREVAWLLLDFTVSTHSEKDI